MERELRELSERVARLERNAGLFAQGAVAPHAAGIPPGHPLTTMPNLLPIAGRALVGLAGAYLLRALAESGVLPARLGTAAGVAYALFWLAWAGRRPPAERWKAAIDSLTALLILAPLLWEATTRFHLVAPAAAAGVLLIFAIFGLAISWRKGFSIVATFATVATIATGAALLLATHDVLPFTLLFLAVGATLEISACRGHVFRERWLAAAAADLAMLLAAWLVANPRGLPPDYAPIPGPWLRAAQLTLLAVYLSSIVFRTLWQRHSITTFETAQCAAAFAIGLGGGWRSEPIVAGAMLICAAACYLVCFARPARERVCGRNFHTYSTFAILLMLAATWTLFSGALAAIWWFALAVASLWLGGRFTRATLQVHGAVYLLLGLAASGVLQASAGLLLGSAAWPGGAIAAFSAGLASSAAAYALVLRYTARTVCTIAIAGACFWVNAATVAGLLTATYRAAFGLAASNAYCATLRTAALGSLALFLAWAGSRWQRPELSLLVYPAMLLGVYRLLARDLGEGNKGTLFLSLLLLGTVLMALPRLKARTARGG
jgi:hypothetical protein